jgi:hypothetical protein
MKLARFYLSERGVSLENAQKKRGASYRGKGRGAEGMNTEPKCNLCGCEKLTNPSP